MGGLGHEHLARYSVMDANSVPFADGNVLAIGRKSGIKNAAPRSWVVKTPGFLAGFDVRENDLLHGYIARQDLFAVRRKRGEPNPVSKLPCHAIIRTVVKKVASTSRQGVFAVR